MTVREFLRAWLPAIVVLVAAQLATHAHFPRVAWFATFTLFGALYGFGAILGGWYVIRRWFWDHVHPELRRTVEEIERNVRET